MARICVPVCVRRLNELHNAMNAAARVGDLVELRADCLAVPDLKAEQLQEVVLATKRPLILTLRSHEQGGATQCDTSTRRRFWLSVKELPADSFVDLELDLV